MEIKQVFKGEAAELSPDQLSIAIAKPMVRRAHVAPGLCPRGLFFSWGFYASELRVLLVPCFQVLDFKLQRAGGLTQLGDNAAVLFGRCTVFGSPKQKELMKCLKQKRPKPSIIAIRSGNRWVSSSG